MALVDSELIHPTAIIDPEAVVADDVQVGPYAIIEGQVRIDSGCVIEAHACLSGPLVMGKNNLVGNGAILGKSPQHRGYRDEPTGVEIGDNNEIREFCTFNIGTAQDIGVTRIGNNNWIMAYVHLAHDCQIGNHTIFANNAQLAGHVTVEDFAILGGFTVVHQFCRIGTHSITAMGTILLQDIPPYVTVSGNPASPHGINSEGLKRRGFSSDAILEIRRAYKTLYKSGLSLQEAKDALFSKVEAHAELGPFLEFISGSKRGIVR
jgi:UDP-N-acetylglucosamine acyltransferase